MTQFFGYWAGSLPLVSDLHFKSFLYYHPRDHYDLWLDDDFSSSIPAELCWIKKTQRINIRYISLNKLIRDHVRPLTLNADGKIYDALRFIHRKKILRYINLKSYYSKLFKLIYMHSSPLFSYKLNLVYRGDLARCIIPSQFYDGKSLYSDIDVCFLSDLNLICANQGFVYQWEDYDFANTAILYSPDKNSAARILSYGNQVESFRPWDLFTTNICKTLDLRIYSNKHFDAMWNKNSLMYGDTSKFFIKTNDSLRYFEELLNTDYYVNHWHNNWKTIPEKGSPYDLLEKYFSTRLNL